MARQTFRVSGRVINRTTRRAVGGLRVEAWDRDIKHNDPLGSAITDDKGSFRISYDISAFNDERRRPRPDLFFKVFQGRKLVATTASMPIENAGRRRTVTIEVEVTGARGASPAGPSRPGASRASTPAKRSAVKARGTSASSKKASSKKASPEKATANDDQPGAPLTAEGSPEVSMHELGESVAASLANVQHELDRYQSPLGAFVVDEIDLTIPVRMRVDEMGQVMVIVSSDADAGTPGITEVRLRIKPVLGSHTEPMMAGTQSIEDVTVAKEISPMLQRFRVFTVNDFRRVTRTPQGRAAMQRQLGWNESMMNAANDQIALLALPVLPVAVSSVMTTRLNFRRIQEFLDADSRMIADIINEELQSPTDGMVTAEHVECWKRETQTFLAIRVPCVSTDTTDNGGIKRIGQG